VMQGAVPAFTISDTAPVGAVAGQMWWESDSGILWMYYNDGTSSQWVEVGGGSGISQTFADANYAPIEALAASGMQVNGGMEVSQEFGLNTVVAIPASGVKYVMDGWKFAPSNLTTFNARQIYAFPVGGGATGMTFCLHLYTTAGATAANNDALQLQQSIEGYRFNRLRFGTANAIPVTIGFWIASTAAGTISIALRNADVTRSYVANVTLAGSAAWEYKTITVPGCTDGNWDYGNGAGLHLSITFGSTGTAYQAAANTWVAANAAWTSAQTNVFGAANNNVYITGFTVLPASYALTGTKMRYAMRPFDQELELCQRYFQNNIGNEYVSSGACTSTTTAVILLPLRRIMRAMPTITISAVADYGLLASGGGATACSALSGGLSSPRVVALNATIAAALMVSGGAANLLGMNANSRINLDARL